MAYNPYNSKIGSWITTNKDTGEKLVCLWTDCCHRVDGEWVYVDPTFYTLEGRNQEALDLLATNPDKVMIVRRDPKNNDKWFRMSKEKGGYVGIRYISGIHFDGEKLTAKLGDYVERF